MRKFSLTLAIALMTFTSCSSLKPIEFRAVENFNVSKLSLNPQISADAKFFNPNPVGAKLKNLKADIFIRNDSLTSIFLPKVAKASAGKEFSIPFSASISVLELAQMIPSEILNFKSGAALPVEVRGSVTVKKFIFSKTFPFQFSETIDTKQFH